jgi:hypothetical protein
MNKTKMVGVWYTPDSYSFIKEQAEKNGVKLGTYLREVSIGKIRQARKDFDENQTELNLGFLKEREVDKLFIELSRVKGSLNKIARAMTVQFSDFNEGKDTKEPVQLTGEAERKVVKTLKETNDIVNKLLTMAEGELI